MLKDIFGFPEGRKKATHGLCYKLTLTRNKGVAVWQKAVALADARNKSDHIHRYVPQYTPSIPQQGILSKQISSTTLTELGNFERSAFMKEVNNQKVWNFELGSQLRMNVYIRTIIGFLQRDMQTSQNLKNDTFCRLRVTSAQ